jgi:hypothetical protein
MRPTWAGTLFAAALGCVAGAFGTALLRDSATATSSTRGAPGDGAIDGRDGPRKREEIPILAPGVAEAPPRKGATGPPAPEAERVRGWIADLDGARRTKDREAFEGALRALFRSRDPEAHRALRDLVADPGFDFPDARYANWFGGSDELRSSAIPGWAAAARARYDRDARKPGFTWDAGSWLYLVAAHADAEDVAWIASRYDVALERPGEAMAALGWAPPRLAREALLAEVLRQPPRDGLWDAISRLAERSPVDAYGVLEAVVAGDTLASFDRGEVLRAWVRYAPATRLGEVRARILAMAAASPCPWELMTPVQALADREEGTGEFAFVIGSAGVELRRLVEAEHRADGTGPYYAIEYHRIAQTPENLASLEYAIQVLGPERTRGCQKVLAEARARSEWK